MTPQYTSLTPKPALRVLRQPLCDAERAERSGSMAPANFFRRPIGMNCKTFVDTNMVMVGCLPQPCEFDLYGFRMEADPQAKLDAVLAFRFASRLRFTFGPDMRQWFSVPLSLIPMSIYLYSPEAARLSSAVLDVGTEAFAEAWKDARIVDHDVSSEELNSEMIADSRHIFRTKTIESVCVCQKPIRIRAAEVFGVDIETNWHCLPDSIVSLLLRIYMVGHLYTTL